MNTRHIQNFFMVSTAFFAMTGPVRSQGASESVAMGAQVQQPVGEASLPGEAAMTTSVARSLRR